jgi:hypothetical protein
MPRDGLQRPAPRRRAHRRQDQDRLRGLRRDAGLPEDHAALDAPHGGDLAHGGRASICGRPPGYLGMTVATLEKHYGHHRPDHQAGASRVADDPAAGSFPRGGVLAVALGRPNGGADLRRDLPRLRTGRGAAAPCRRGATGVLLLRDGQGLDPCRGSAGGFRPAGPRYAPGTRRTSLNGSRIAGAEIDRSPSVGRWHHLVHTEGVTGSIPVASTILFKGLGFSP